MSSFIVTPFLFVIIQLSSLMFFHYHSFIHDKIKPII